MTAFIETLVRCERILNQEFGSEVPTAKLDKLAAGTACLLQFYKEPDLIHSLAPEQKQYFRSEISKLLSEIGLLET